MAFDKIDSRSELLECLKKSPPSLLLGGEDEAARDFYINRETGCTVGICSQGHGVKPSRLVDESLGIAWIGYNLKVANVNLRACRTNFVIELSGVFFFSCRPNAGWIGGCHSRTRRVLHKASGRG